MVTNKTVHPATQRQLRDLAATLIQAIPDLNTAQFDYLLNARKLGREVASALDSPFPYGKEKRRPENESQKLFLLLNLLFEIIAPGLTHERCQEYISNKGEFIRKVRGVLLLRDIGQLERQRWERFYLDEYRLKVDFSHVSVPRGDGLVVLIPKGLTHKRAIIACRPYYEVTIADDIVDRRKPSTSYGVAFEVDPKEDLCDLTSLERIVMEHYYFKAMGKHLPPSFCSSKVEGRSPVFAEYNPENKSLSIQPYL